MQMVHDPQGPVEVPTAVDRAEIRLDGELTIGLLDNGKPNADLLLATMGRLLCGLLPGSRVVAATKFGDGDGAAAMRPVLPEKLAWLIKECDVVLTGSGD